MYDCIPISNITILDLQWNTVFLPHHRELSNTMILDNKLIEDAAHIKLASPLTSFSNEMALWCAGVHPDFASSTTVQSKLLLVMETIQEDIYISSHIHNLKQRAKIIVSSAKVVPY